jgi:DNA-binding PadR family transcriptional regulator
VTTTHVRSGALSPNEFHVLLVLADKPLYGYAIQKAVEHESGGAVNPEIGSLYRILARLMVVDLVRETVPPADASPDGRGRPRQYYQLTKKGTRVLAAELERLRVALELARDRKLVTD